MSESRYRKHIDFLILDILCLVFSFFISYFIRHYSVNLLMNYNYKLMLFIIIGSNIIVYFFSEPFSGILDRGLLVELKQTIIFDIIQFFVIVTYLFLTKESETYSRITITLTYCFYFVISYVTRILYKKLLRSKAKYSLTKSNKSLLVLCKEKELNEVIKNISKSNYNFYQISGICVIDKDLENTKYKDYDIVSNISNVLDYIATNWVDEIFIACDYNLLPKEVIEGFYQTGISIHVIANQIELFNNRPQVIEKVGNYTTITTIRKSYSNYQLFMKRVIDIVGAIVGCLFTLVLILILGPIIYIKSPGNIFYVSDRVGKNGKVFKFYKFRSMRLDADDIKESLQKDNRVKDGMMFKIKDDPRIIPGIGNFIRKTSLDEFPQFLNVLKGDMSLVGTRPPTMDEWNKYTPYYRSRLTMRPGITGLWQVSGRSNITDFNEIVKLDNEYIDNWRLDLDIKIIFKTVSVIFKKEEGAM